jgi:LCP family protein required for cell wall assembly
VPVVSPQPGYTVETIAARLDTPTPAIAANTEPLALSASATPWPTQTELASLANITTVPEEEVAPATATPTAQDRAEPTLGAFSITPLAGSTLVTPNPTAVLPVEMNESVINVLLVGTDYRATDNTFRTDTLIIASINSEAGVVSLLSVPRDLFVYVPMYGMARINRAYGAAESIGYPGGGPALLEQTILYNLGIPIHYYALVNFDGFRQIVDTLGGIDVPVTCQLTEYKLLEPTLDETDPDNYELFTQPTGITRMDGALALWYARARPVGGDFFRGYRQRQVLRAIYHRALGANVIPQIPALYSDFNEIVATDMGLWDVMQFVPLTTRLGDAQIRSLYIGPNQTTGWTTPSGEAVLLPKADALNTLVADFLSDPADNRLARDLTWVSIINGAPGLASEALAAETLRGDGFGITYGEPADAAYAETMLIDHSTSSKGSPVERLRTLLHLAPEQVISQPNPDSPTQFTLVLGSDYNSCPRLDWMDTTDPATTGQAP